MQAIAKLRPRKCFLTDIPRTRRASRRTELRQVACIRTDFGMLYGEFQHGPLKTIDKL